MYLETVLEESKRNGWDKTLGFDYAEQTVGCSAEEISKLEADTNLTLPVAYKEFLRWAGNGLGDFAVGSDMFYEDADLVELQQDARDILAENNFPHQLPDDAFVFWMHQGYMFCFFRTSEGDNPPVHYYIEAGEGEQEEIKWNYHPNFTDFLIQRIKADAGHLERARQTEERMSRDWTRG